MAVGSGYFVIALVTTIVSSILVLTFDKLSAFKKDTRQTLLRIEISWHDSESSINKIVHVLNDLCIRSIKISQMPIGKDTIAEVYKVEYLEIEKLKQVVDKINNIPGVNECRLHQQEDFLL